jgi:predicted Zn-dependent protease
MGMMRRLPLRQAGVLVVLGALGACATNPATGKRELMLVSEGQEIALGRQEDEKVVASFGEYDDPALQELVATLGHSIAERSERPDLPWTFRLVDDAAVNAFALPGGFVYMTRGILAYLDSEAQLAMVMGHEVGHVTARHSAQQISSQQLMSLGMGVGMIAVPELRRYGDLAQLGLGLLFLKFGRDDESEADTLGLRYSVRLGYDPVAGAGAFHMLDQLSAQSEAGRVPGWLSTHPDPGDRYRRLLGAIQDRGLAGGHVRRDAYLERLDGVTIGENPREGFFREGVFYHPDLRFRFEPPRGFEGQNTRQAVWAVSPSGDAVFQLTLAEGRSPDDAARGFFGDREIRTLDTDRTSVNGLSAVVGTFDTQSGQTLVRGLAAFIRLGDRLFRLIGYAGRSDWSRYSGSFGDAVSSFGPLHERWALDVQPRRLEIVVPRRNLTLAEFMDRYPSTVPEGTVAVINQLEAGEVLEAGQPAKRVVGGDAR